MTADEYAGKSNAIELEMRRIRGILDRHAFAKEKGLAGDDNPLIQKTSRELTATTERFKALDREFWGAVLADEG